MNLQHNKNNAVSTQTLQASAENMSTITCMYWGIVHIL